MMTRIPITGLRKIENGEYVIRQYVKPISNEDAGLFRSVIHSLEDNRMVCFSPPKSTSFMKFKEDNPDLTQITVEAFVEGTMVNAFYDKGSWRIATKSKMGAECNFYENTPTFAAMFAEACAACEFSLDSLNPKMCYSFVLQHPLNRIVTLVERPSLFVVDAYIIEGDVVLSVLKTADLPNGLKRAPQYTFSNYDDMYAALLNEPYTVKGYVLKNDFCRAKIRNGKYEHVSDLRGNTPVLKYNVVRLFKEGAVQEFLKFYPELKRPTEVILSKIKTVVNQLFSLYMECFVHKKKPLKEYAYDQKPHLWALHKIYLAQRPMPIHKKLVNEYVKSISQSKLFYMLKA
jgi:hypothetical protein